MDDKINSPSHYRSHPSGIECITITEHMSSLRGNAIKYLWRADHKNGLEDLKKARWYVDREIAQIEVSITAPTPSHAVTSNNPRADAGETAEGGERG